MNPAILHFVSLAIVLLLSVPALAAAPTPQRVTAIEVLDKATLYRKSSAYLGFSCRTAPEGDIEQVSEQEQSAPRNAFWIRKNEYNESFLQTVTIPIRAFFQGMDDNPKYFDGKLNPLLLILPFFAFIRSHNASFPAPLLS